MAELADAPDLGSGGTPVQVQVLSPVPRRGDALSAAANPNLIHPYQEWWRERPCETRQPSYPAVTNLNSGF